MLNGGCHIWQAGGASHADIAAAPSARRARAPIAAEMMAFTLDAVRQLVRGFATASLAFGIVSLISGTSGVSCALQLASGAHWLSITQSAETFAAALAASGARASCCGASLRAIRGINIAGIVIGVLDGIWVRFGG